MIPKTIEIASDTDAKPVRLDAVPDEPEWVRVSVGTESLCVQRDHLLMAARNLYGMPAGDRRERSNDLQRLAIGIPMLSRA